MLVFGNIGWNNLIQPFKINDNKYTFGNFADKSEILEISVKINMEYFGDIDMS